MAVVDAALVFSNQLQRPNEVINAAVPLQRVPLPQLQFIDIHRRKRKRRQEGVVVSR